jgi:hypothetical protein
MPPVQQFHRNVIIEINHEHLILGIARARKRRNRIAYFFQLRAHAAAVVHNQSHSDGRVSLLEHGNSLQTPIFVHTRKFCSLSPSTALPLASVTLTGSTTSSVCTEIADEAGGGGLDCAKPASAEHSSAAVKTPQRQIPLHVCDRMIRITGEAPRAAGYEPSFRPAAHRSLLRL